MNNFKKILTFIMILIIIVTLPIGVFANNIFTNSNFKKEKPVKIGVFLSDLENMYVSLVKQDLERMEKENKDKVKFIFFDAKGNKSLQNESIEKSSYRRRRI